MQKFFSKILKNKIIIFSLLFLIIGALAIPGRAYALWPFSEIAEGVFNAIVLLFFAVPVLVSVIASSVTGLILDAAILFANNAHYTTGVGVLLGWNIVRNLANMIVVLGFVVIGIATALRVKQYEAKILLKNLIIAAILINFSLLLCGLLIDGTNILMKQFFTPNGSATLQGFEDVWSIIENFIGGDPFVFVPILIGVIFFNLIAVFTNLVYGAVILARVVAIWVFIILSPLAFVCYVFPATKKVWSMWWSNFIQWCIIIAPLGLFYYIGAKIKSAAIATSQPQALASVINNGTAGLSAYISNSIQTALIPGLFLIVGFLVSLQFAPAGASAIMNFAKKNAGRYAKGAVGVLGKAHEKTTGKLMGAAGKYLQTHPGAGRIGKTIGGAMASEAVTNPLGFAKRRSQQTGSLAGRMAEAAGAQPVGAQAAADQARVEAAAKLATSAYTSGNAKDKARIEEQAKNATGVAQAATLQAIAGEGKLHEVFKDAAGNTDLGAIHEALTAAEKTGASRNIRKKAQDAMPGLAAYNKDNVEELMGKDELVDKFAGKLNMKTGARTGGKINPATGAVYTEAEAQIEAGGKVNPATGAVFTRAEAGAEAVKQAVIKTAPSKAAEWRPEVITSELAAILSVGQAKEIGTKGMPELVDKLRAIKYRPPDPRTGRFAAQSPEYRAAKKAVQAAGPVGSAARTKAENNFVALQKQLASDPNFA